MPNLVAQKQKMIEQLTNKKKTAGTRELLDKLMFKKKAKIQISAPKDDNMNDSARDWEDDEDDNGADPKERKAKKQFMKEFHKIIEMADIIIEVLDARDPISSRCKEAERLLSMSKHEKKLIIVLNKIDLVPLPIVMAWKKELEREYPVILFKANTQRQTINFGQNILYQNSLNTNPELVADMLKSSKSLGTHKLFELIKNYSRNGKEKKAVSVGVIGYPNVGKSSIINSLKRKRAASVSSKAGHTKSLQEFEIDSKVKVIDSPGVILSSDNECLLVLRNQINASEVKDPITPIRSIIDRVNMKSLMHIYKINHFKDDIEFLYNIALVKGKFKKVAQ